MATRIVYGRDVRAVPSLEATVAEAIESPGGFDFVVVPLVHPRHTRDLLDELPRTDPSRRRPLTRSDKVLTGNDWSTVVVGRLSTPGIALDAPTVEVRRNSERMFHQEVAWAMHLGVPALMLPQPTADPVNYAMNLATALPSFQQCQVWVHVPLSQRRHRTAPGEDAIVRDPWENWNALRLLCDHNAKLSVALELTEDLPEPDILKRWVSEPVKAIFVPTRVFLTNKAGFPVLPKSHQAFIKSLMPITQHIVISGRLEHPKAKADNGSHGMVLYRQYLEFLHESIAKGDEITRGYNDYLQFPLQPLADNLESAVYEVFEKDPIKYKLYEEAVHEALVNLKKKNDNDSAPVTLMVVGAGRGPLVDASLRAAEKAKCAVKVFAVEKNPNAIVTLDNLVADKWGDRVTVIPSDMRVWTPPSLADILVSELLGSFGDNELSPECLDGAQRLLKPDGVSIPQNSTSFIVPVSCSKVYNDVSSFNDLEHFETPFVVKLTGCWLMSDIKPLFMFEHPNRKLNQLNQPDNTRYATVRFTASASALLHGIAGYFESVLFGDIILSIHPATHSPGMFSWFPIFFPLRSPMPVRAGSVIDVTFWRRVSTKKVWYEWCVCVDNRPSPVHNPNGRSYSIGL